MLTISPCKVGDGGRIDATIDFSCNNAAPSIGRGCCVAWIDGISVNGVLQGVSAVAAAVSAIGACAAARATYRSIDQPAQERMQEARAIAIAALDGFVVQLASLRRDFAIYSLGVSFAQRSYKEGKRDEVVKGIRLMSGANPAAYIPQLPAGYHNLDLVLALNRLRASFVEWEAKTKGFTFELHSAFDDKETLEIRALEKVEALRVRAMNDMRILGKLLGDLLPARKEELSIVVHPSDGYVMEEDLT
ncbi:hypothetical protein [Stenotrophomonas maltophilia]|uniref:hypothetical protein n=1 Tax=Stenotrophomonas maltophilia TaxID=40324 RepID=UPI0013DAEB90|nr:hypothetical protein [Stenotrophomonas maltophilia]MBN5053129.1 hypothetical protein [Stenotrophomonas maltophilia]